MKRRGAILFGHYKLRAMGRVSCQVKNALSRSVGHMGCSSHAARTLGAAVKWLAERIVKARASLHAELRGHASFVHSSARQRFHERAPGIWILHTGTLPWERRCFKGQ